MIKITIKLLFLILIAALGYNAALYMRDQNINLTIAVLDYNITINIALAFLCFGFAIITSIIILRLLVYIINLPTSIIQYKNNFWGLSTEKVILNCYNNIIMATNFDNARLVLAKLFQNSASRYLHYLHFINLNITNDFSQKIVSLRYLINIKEYRVFALKKLAKIYVEIGYYDEALELISCINEDDVNSLLLTLEIYFQLKSYNKFSTIINKLNKIDQIHWQDHFPIIANYYLEAAKAQLHNGLEQQAISYIELALLYKPNIIEAIDLYCILNINMGTPGKNIELIEKTFSQYPSFELFELYLRSTNYSAEKLYKTLYEISSPKNDFYLFLAISSYLKLHEETDRLMANRMHLLPPSDQPSEQN